MIDMDSTQEEDIKQEEKQELDALIVRSMEALEKKDALAMRTISADANSLAAVEGHRELILLALVDYALSKIMSKVHYGAKDGDFYGKITGLLSEARTSSKEVCISKLEEIEDLVIKLDREEGNYNRNIMDKARIKKASKLYEQGLSLRRASELTGADPVEVLDYVGGSKIHEFKGGGKNAKRLQAAREVFK
jgi:hypothetical protein